MTDLTRQLQTDTSTFLDRLGNHPLYIEDPTFTPAVKRHVDDGPTHDLLKIMGHDRIAYAAIAFKADVVRVNDKWRFFKQDIYKFSRMDEYGNPVANTDGIAASWATRFY